ncbi:hypothetical protein Mycch_3482 [Mycolicibacterium chubuense NBB4]|uniref:Secreted protein n=1 Tax=Mycolicibacterium chubuense (strain NBB4) TaxID=710421 RepID=I4BLR2_MYCCN|nr:hypothetical protein [Mycolicibacterium chubuense]AFM18219.1 hypothetical protein Mycch_3482 [Mycolicibacterium chubuense NBB4]
MLTANSLTLGAAVVVAAGLTGAGLSIAPIPAQAAPGGCQQFAFNGFTTIRATQDGQVTDINFTSNDPTFNGPVSAPSTGLSAPGSAAIDGGGHVELNVADAQSLINFAGDVGPDNKIHGTLHLQKADFVRDLPANSQGTVKCAKQAPKEGPTVEYSPILGGLNVHVTDRSGTTSQCTYNSDGFTRTFRLDANSSTDLKIVPAIPKFANWNVKITCDNGAVTETTQFF